jgi:peptide/nickel transport system permease protein
MRETATVPIIPTALEELPEQASPPLALVRALWRFITRKPLGAFGALLVLVMLAMGVLAEVQTRFDVPVAAPYHPVNDQVLSERLQGPSLDHWLGTDQLGRDIFSRIVFGARTSIFIGFGAVLIATALSAVIGIVSGYYGGKIDTLIQRGVDIWIAFPGLILLIFLISVFGQDKLQITVALGMIIAPLAARVVRGAVIAIRGNLYVEAARTIGASDLRILWVYILPNVLAIIIVGVSIQVGAAILAESSLSFLGFGVAPPEPSWGRMLRAEGRQYMVSQPGLAIWPGLAITLAVFGFNVFGDALRDVLDPRLRGT